MKPWIPVAVVLALSVPLGFAVAPSLFGSTLLCQEFAIDGARSLPWDEGKTQKAEYDRSRLVSDVAEVLETQEDLVVRMETLRRAAIYTGSDRALAWELLGRRSLAVLEQSSIGASGSIGARESIAWFDTGLLVACFAQHGGLDLGFRAGIGEGIPGYAYLLKALDCARKDQNGSLATIEFAAALVSHPGMRPGGGNESDHERYHRHMDAARKGAREGSLLAKNVAVFEKRFRPQAPARKTGGSNEQE